jgi:HAD superfamily hydrolase (TIGR01509 family)
MNKFSCVIFDIDGTLTQTNELIFDSFNHVAQKYLKKTFAPEEIIGMFGPPEEIAIERLVGKENVDKAMDDYISYYDRNFLSDAEIFEGMKEIIESLKKKGLRLGIFTGKGRRTTLITLDKIGITKYFDMVVTGTDVTNHKPSSEGIIKIIDNLKVQPNQVLMVGDAVSDIKAAHEAGVSIAAVVWDSYAKEKVIGMEVDYLFHSVEEFSRWMQMHVPGNGANVN